MTDVLLLGGTGWLGSRIAERWLDAGASVTCLARGGRDAPYTAATALSEWARHITFVSSVSAYAADDEPDADESAPLAEPAAAGLSRTDELALIAALPPAPHRPAGA